MLPDFSRSGYVLIYAGFVFLDIYIYSLFFPLSLCVLGAVIIPGKIRGIGACGGKEQEYIFGLSYFTYLYREMSRFQILRYY